MDQARMFVSTIEPKMTISEAASYLSITPQALHLKIKNLGLQPKRYKNKFYFGHEIAKVLFQIVFKKKSVALLMAKGGVGKTEVTFETGIGATLYGAKVCIVDFDSQANLTEECLRFDPSDRPVMIDVIKDNIKIEDCIVNLLPGLDLIPSDIVNSLIDNVLLLGSFPLDRVYRAIFEKLKEFGYDLILVDCPPSLATSVTAIMLGVDEIASPVIPDKRAVKGIKIVNQAIHEMEKKYNIKINQKILYNQYNARNNLSSKIYNDLKEHEEYKDKLYKTIIRTDQEFPKAVNEGVSIFDTFRSTKAKEDIHLFVRELLDIDNPKIGMKEKAIMEAVA